MGYTDSQIKDFYKQALETEKRREETIPYWWLNGADINDADKERVKDYLEDIGLKKETDLEDQISDFLTQYLDKILAVIALAIPGVGTAISGVLAVIAKYAGEEIANQLGPDVKKGLDQITNRMKKDKWSKWVAGGHADKCFFAFMYAIRGATYDDIFVDGDYKKVQNGSIKLKSDKGKKVSGRIIWYRNVFCDQEIVITSRSTSEFNSVVCKFSDSPKDFADKIVLNFRRFKGKDGDKGLTGRPHVHVSEGDYLRIFRVHEFLQNQAESLTTQQNKEVKTNKDGTVKNTKNNAVIIGGIAAAALSFLS